MWRVAENTCKGLVSHYHTQQYSACETVELVPESEKAVRRASDYLRVGTPSDKFLMSEEAERRQAFDLVERVIEAGSDAVLDLLDQIFSKGLQERPSQTAIGELRSLAARFSATVDDFEQVYAWVE